MDNPSIFFLISGAIGLGFLIVFWLKIADSMLRKLREEISQIKRQTIFGEEAKKLDCFEAWQIEQLVRSSHFKRDQMFIPIESLNDRVFLFSAAPPSKFDQLSRAPSSTETEAAAQRLAPAVQSQTSTPKSAAPSHYRETISEILEDQDHDPSYLLESEDQYKEEAAASTGPK